jgi:AraC family transcriptional regulator of arabinose operon
MAEDIVSFAGLWRGDLPFCTEMVGVSYCDGSYRIRRERSPIYVFEYVERGEGRVRVDGREFIARAGDVYLLPRGSDHEYASSRANPWVKMWMNASGPLLDSLIPLYGLDSVYHVPGYDARMLFERILAAARSGGDARDIFGRIALLCHELLIGLAARVGRGAGGVPERLRRCAVFSIGASSRMSASPIWRRAFIARLLRPFACSGRRSA